MTITDKLVADKAALLEAQVKVATLQAEIDKETNKMRAVQPHLDLLSSIESQLAMIEATVEPDLATKIDPIRLTILSNVSQIRELILSNQT